MTYTNANAFNLFTAGFCFSAALVYALEGKVWLCLLQLMFTLLNLGIVYVPKLAIKDG